MTNPIQPGRPFGLTLALVAILIVFVMMPLLMVVYVLVVNDFMVMERGAYITGIDLPALDTTPYLIQGAISLWFLGLVLMAWRGRPAWVRWLLPLSLIILTGLTIISQVLPLISQPSSLSNGIDSTSTLIQPLAMGYAVLTITITTYTTWFVNRWSSRAFFRGYYVEKDKNHLAQWQNTGDNVSSQRTQTASN